jgi:hypothetical protein
VGEVEKNLQFQNKKSIIHFQVHVQEFGRPQVPTITKKENQMSSHNQNDGPIADICCFLLGLWHLPQIGA